MVYENVMVMSFGVLPIVFQRNVDIGPCKTAGFLWPSCQRGGPEDNGPHSRHGGQEPY